jgi:hypothetical protein
MVKIVDVSSGWIYSEDGSRYLDVWSSKDILSIKFGAKQSLKGVFPNDVTLDIFNPNKPTDIFYNGPMLFVSSKIVQIILKYSTELIELFPVRVRWNGYEYNETRFFLIKVMDEVDCIDKGQSEYIIDKYDEEDDSTAFMSEINKLVIHPIDENIHKVFFINSIFGVPLKLAVSDDIAQEMLSQECSGCELIDISSYRKL